MLVATDNTVDVSHALTGSNLAQTRLGKSWFSVESGQPTQRISTNERDAKSRLKIEPAAKVGFAHIADTLVLLLLLVAGCGAIASLGMMAADAYAELISLNPVNMMRVLGGVR